MNMGRIVTAIDVGTSKVCTIVADMSQETIPRILGMGLIPSQGIQKAIVSNMAQATEAIQGSITRAEQSSGLRIESAYVGISGQHIGSFNTRATVGINRRDHLVTDKATKKAFELSKKVNLPEDRKMLHTIPRYYTLDGQTGIKNPTGMYGYRLDVETHIITAGITFVLNLVKCVQSSGVRVMDLVSEPVADSEAILEPEEKEAGVLLADIGCGTTDLTVFKGRDIWYTSALPVAGYQLTKDLSLGLGIPFAVAEELKKNYGNVMPGERDKENVIPLGEKRSVPYAELYHIIYPRTEEIFKLVLAELSQAELAEEEISNLVLCGGCANLVGIDALAHEIMGYSVRVASPKGIVKSDTILNDPAYATAVGLLLWGAKQREQEVPSLRKLIGRFFSQLARLWPARRG
jgi:cell division protein FtsA